MSKCDCCGVEISGADFEKSSSQPYYFQCKDYGNCCNRVVENAAKFRKVLRGSGGTGPVIYF
jgi:hypothetical protein